MKPLIPLAALAALALTACAADPKAPNDPGVCWHVSPQEDGSLKFNKVAQNVADMEHCAVELERMRLSFLRMGGNKREIAGAYQGNFIFLRDEGIYRAQRYNGGQYLALVRYNGKLVMPGAVPQ
jgi:hypothetical protein